MTAPSLAGEVCVLAADLDHATALLAGADPADLAEVSVRLDSAARRLGAIMAGGGLASEQAADLARRMRRVNSLFHHGAAFYRGWAALAGVAESDRVAGSISYRG
jgi:hypothetical protein